MVYRVYVEKKAGFDHEAQALAADIRGVLGISGLTGLRLVNRYDVEHIDSELFEYCKRTVFSEPQPDTVYDTLDASGYGCFAVEYLPGQFDQRADSAAQCIQIISQSERPVVHTAKVYLLQGALTADEVRRIKKYVINPVEAREAALDKPQTLKLRYERPTRVKTLTGFRGLDSEGLRAFIADYGLAMDLEDIRLCQSYFINERRDPTITEIRMLDTYWSDHCRHTTFLTTVDSVEFEDGLLSAAYEEYLALRRQLGRDGPISLMDIGTIAARYMRATGRLSKLDESEEINACTVKIDVESEPWLLLFKNETHNHPTEIEPFGGAATCIGGAIRDPLSGRSYVYAAMRLTGAADPTQPVSETLPGKLPQRKIVTAAAAGYSSYGNQVGLCTGQVDELYHPGYAAKRMEIGAVIGAAPAANVRRERPMAGDRIILIGGRTGRDGCGGATGSSKSHDLQSLESCGAEVQKGNAPEERKLQRLFRNPEAALLIKRCNDFGAGGVAVAVGELADGIRIDLDAVPKKYEGLDGTELAISESQERMAVVVAPEGCERFLQLAAAENLEATVVAEVEAEPRLIMEWNGERIVDISRGLLNSNGAPKHITITPAAPLAYEKTIAGGFAEQYTALAADLNVCSKRGLGERFDASIGAGTVLMPYGGKYQRTPIQAMVHKIPVEGRDTDTCSLMAWGYNPFIAEKSPYHSAYLAVVESVCKLIATGAAFEDVYLTFQEYFEKPMRDGRRWGKPLAALLGAFKAQMALGIAAIGGKDSMSGTFLQLDVPPTLVSFAVTVDRLQGIVSPEFKAAGHRVVIIAPERDASGLPTGESLQRNFALVTELLRSGGAVAAYTPGIGGIAEAVLKMCMGNGIGFVFEDGVNEIFGYSYGAFVLELAGDGDIGRVIGRTTDGGCIEYGGERLTLAGLTALYENRLEGVYPGRCRPPERGITNLAPYNATVRYTAAVKTAKPLALIPVFPGTNCEYDTAKAFRIAGAEPEVIVVRNLTSADIAQSIEYFAERVARANIILVPGGFSGGDEPDGSGKFITAFFRNARVRDALTAFLDERDGLLGGICNGFQALIKLGLVPYGKIIDTDASCPTLTYNAVGFHQSRIVRTRVVSNKSPWFAETVPGEVYTVPISHGEGRLVAADELVRTLAQNGQVATQYVDLDGNAAYDIDFNPNGSAYAIEGITSADGRVFGKMGHSERIGGGLYRNVPGAYDMGLFRSAVRYFK